MGKRDVIFVQRSGDGYYCRSELLGIETFYPTLERLEKHLDIQLRAKKGSDNHLQLKLEEVLRKAKQDRRDFLKLLNETDSKISTLKEKLAEIEPVPVVDNELIQECQDMLPQMIALLRGEGNSPFTAKHGPPVNVGLAEVWDVDKDGDKDAIPMISWSPRKIPLK